MSLKSLINREGNTMQAMWVAMGSLSSFALAIVSAAILSRYFNKAEYGTYRQILYIYNTLLIIFTAGLPRVYSYFLPRYSLEQGRDIVLKISRMLFLLGLVFSLFLFGFSGLIATILKNPELADGLKYFSPMPMLLLPTLGIEGIFSTYKKTIYIAIYNTSTRLLMLIFIVLPVIIFNGTYIHAIMGWIAVSIISFVVAYYMKEIPFKGIQPEKTILTWKLIFSYSLPLVGATFAGIAMKSADQFYISRYYGTEIFAEYVNGFIEIPFVGMVTGATAMVLMPQFSKMIYEKAEIFEITNLWRNVLIKSAIVIYPIVMFFIFNAKSIVVLLYSIDYVNSAIYFQIAMIVNFFNIVIFAPLLFSMGETKFYFRAQLAFALLAWVGGYILVSCASDPQYIAFYSVSISIGLVIVFLGKISKLLQVSFWNLLPVKKISLILFHTLIVILIVVESGNYLLKSQTDFFRLLIYFCFYVLILLGTSSVFKIDYLSFLKPLLYRKRAN
ncbi:MAG: oligosaccharide flippase family protein [Lentimicrobium sp.]